MLALARPWVDLFPSNCMRSLPVGGTSRFSSMVGAWASGLAAYEAAPWRFTSHFRSWCVGQPFCRRESSIFAYGRGSRVSIYIFSAFFPLIFWRGLPDDNLAHAFLVARREEAAERRLRRPLKGDCTKIIQESWTGGYHKVPAGARPPTKHGPLLAANHGAAGTPSNTSRSTTPMHRPAAHVDDARHRVTSFTAEKYRRAVGSG